MKKTYGLTSLIVSLLLYCGVFVFLLFVLGQFPLKYAQHPHNNIFLIFVFLYWLTFMLLVLNVTKVPTAFYHLVTIKQHTVHFRSFNIFKRGPTMNIDEIQEIEIATGVPNRQLIYSGPVNKFIISTSDMQTEVLMTMGIVGQKSLYDDLLAMGVPFRITGPLSKPFEMDIKILRRKTILTYIIFTGVITAICVSEAKNDGT